MFRGGILLNVNCWEREWVVPLPGVASPPGWALWEAGCGTWLRSRIPVPRIVQ